MVLLGKRFTLIPKVIPSPDAWKSETSLLLTEENHLCQELDG